MLAFSAIGLLLAQGLLGVAGQSACQFQNNGTNYFAGFPSELKHAKGFQLEYGTNTVSIDVPGASVSLLLYLCSLPTVPSTTNGRRAIRIPIDGAAVSGSGVLTFIQRIGMGPQIASADSRVNADACLDVPSIPTTLPSGQFLFDSKYSEAVTRETDPLAMGEWIKFFGTFFGPDGIRSAEVEFAKMEATFSCIRAATSQYQSTTTPDKIPVLGAYAAATGQVFEMADESVWTALAGAAGANFSSLPSQSVPVQGWKDIAKKLDVVFDFSNPTDEGYNMKKFNTNFDIVDSQEGIYPFLDNTASKVFRTDLQRSNRNGVMDYNEARYAQPDLLLADLIYLMNPTFNPNKESRPYWFRSLSNDPGKPPRTCPPNRAWSPFLNGIYCEPTWKYTPALKRLSVSPSDTIPTSSTSEPNPSNTEFKGSGSRSSGSTLTPLGIVFIIAAVLAVSAGAITAFLLLKARKRNEERTFYEIGSRRSVLAGRRGDDLNNGITLQDMT
ncbi:hypothetical protein HDU67_009510 [Dinochytrium kinnereticum]|nr:hypothetical protein HDU67_009510 [Dinochytrium kinnereticum]